MAPCCDLYCRVSTLEQAQEGYSLGEQEARLRAYAAAQGWQVHACYTDPGISGATLERPGLQALIADARAHIIDRAVVYKLDRLSRSQRDTLYLIEDELQANGVAFVSMTEALDTSTPLGVAILSILATFAQLERQQIAERMTMGRVAAAKAGKWRGGSGVPIGYRYLRKTATEDGQLVVEPYEAAMVREVFALFLQGRTYHAIYEHMRERYSTAYGRFAGGGAALIPAMLSNQAYIGRIRYAGQWYDGQHEAIIDRATFDRAQARMAEYRATLDEHRRQPYKVGHLLTGLLYCGECGARWCWHSCSYKAKDGTRRTYDIYQCYTRNAHKTQRRAERCSVGSMKAAELEALVWEQVSLLQLEPVRAAKGPSSQLDSYRARLAEIDRQLARLVDLYALGTLPLDAVQDRADALRQEQAHLQAAIAAEADTRLTAQELGDALAGLGRIRDSGTLAEQRQLLQLLIRRITIDAGPVVRIDWNI